MGGPPGRSLVPPRCLQPSPCVSFSVQRLYGWSLLPRHEQPRVSTRGRQREDALPVPRQPRPDPPPVCLYLRCPVGPQGGHGLEGTWGVGKLQAVAGALQESPQEGWGAGPAQGLPHHVTSLPQAPRGAQPRGGRRASAGPPQCGGGSPGRAWGPSPPTREVLFNLMSRLILFPSIPWVRGTMTASFPGIQRGA